MFCEPKPHTVERTTFFRFVFKFTFLKRNLRRGENLRTQQPLLLRLSTDTREGSGDGGGVSEGLVGSPLKIMSISKNSLSCGHRKYTNEVLSSSWFDLNAPVLHCSINNDTFPV